MPNWMSGSGKAFISVKSDLLLVFEASLFFLFFLAVQKASNALLKVILC